MLRRMTSQEGTGLPSCAGCGEQLRPTDTVAVHRDEDARRFYTHRGRCEPETPPVRSRRPPVTTTPRRPNNDVPHPGKSVETGTVWDRPVDTHLHNVVSEILNERPEYP
jgi:hypothetical protein